MLGVGDKVGTLAKGKMANFIITSDDLFKKDNIIYENWVEGRQYVVSRMDVTDLRGNYNLPATAWPNITLKIGGTPGAYEVNVERTGADSTRAKGTITRSGDMVTIYFDLKNKPAGNIRLSGYITAISPLSLERQRRIARWHHLHAGQQPIPAPSTPSQAETAETKAEY